MLERHRPLVVEDARQLVSPAPPLAVRLADPLGDLGRVGHRRRQAHQRHMPRRQQDRLLPCRPALRIAHVVHFVEDDRAHVVDRRARHQHVSQHFGGHHRHRRVAIDDHVTRQQTDLVVAPAGSKVPELLVAQAP